MIREGFLNRGYFLTMAFGMETGWDGNGMGWDGNEIGSLDG